MTDLVIRKTYAQVEETRTVVGKADDRGPLRKVAVCAVVANPFAGRGYVADLSPIVEASFDIGTFVGEEAVRLLAETPESYGKAGVVGTNGEQEHVNAALTSLFGNAFRDAVGGGKAWITSVTKPAASDATIDVPLAFKDEIWVRSHYDALTVHLPDAPHQDEMVIIAAVANRGRINARTGGLTVAEAASREQA